MITPQTMHMLLILSIIGTATIAGLYLRRRKLSVWEYLWWGALALLIPILGPVLVIVAAPGEKKSSPRPTTRVTQ